MGGHEAILSAHGNSQIINVEKFPIIDAFVLEVLCDNPSAAFALLKAWNTYCETSPHRKYHHLGLATCVSDRLKDRLVHETASFA